MLLYPHSFAGLPLLYQVAGSAVPRAVVPALMSMALTLIIEETLSQDFLNHIFAHPYPYTVFANLVGFTLVFRNNIAYNRYWEGITQLRQMSARWGDVRIAAAQTCHTSNTCLPATHTLRLLAAAACSPPSSCSPWTATRSLTLTRCSRDSTRSARRGSSTARLSATASLTPTTPQHTNPHLNPHPNPHEPHANPHEPHANPHANPRSATASRCFMPWPSPTSAARSNCASSPQRP